MASVICTLFEGNYHYGVAALVNSLYKKGFQGEIFAGYRGTLPNWCDDAQDSSMLLGAGAQTLQVADQLQIHFLPLITDYHLTNYKPAFMLSLLNGPASNAEAIYYLDPDIIVSAPWFAFEEWVEHGIALCEDINSPLPEYHPRRMAWRKYYKKENIVLKFRDPIYVNGGFVGLKTEDVEFLTTWNLLQELMAPSINGLNRSALKGAKMHKEIRQNPFSPFGKTDQDALNCAVEVWEKPISFIGKEAMAFKSGAFLLPHALGDNKPWEWKPISQIIFFGNVPRHVDREYWKSANGPITAHRKSLIYIRRFSIKIAVLIGRFYRR